MVLSQLAFQRDIAIKSRARGTSRAADIWRAAKGDSARVSRLLAATMTYVRRSIDRENKSSILSFSLSSLRTICSDFLYRERKRESSISRALVAARGVQQTRLENRAIIFRIIVKHLSQSSVSVDVMLPEFLLRFPNALLMRQKSVFERNVILFNWRLMSLFSYVAQRSRFS